MTYLWQEEKRKPFWRIQTDEKGIYNKLKRRKSTTLAVWGLNTNLCVFTMEFYSPKEAKTSLGRITGRKVNKDAENDEFYA